MLSSLLAIAMLRVPATALDWKQVTANASWDARSDACTLVLGSHMVVAGGHANNDYWNDVWRSSDGATWEKVLANGTAPWPARSYHSCIVLPGDRILLVGGHAGSQWFNDVWISGPGGDVSKWEMVTEHAAFEPRAAGSLLRQPSTGKLFYMGGSNGLLPPVGFHTTLYNDVWTSDDSGKTWTKAIGAAPWKPREGFTGGVGVVAGNSSITVMGGEAGYFPWAFFSDIWTSEDGASWTQRAEKASWTGMSAGSIWNLKGRSGHIVAKQELDDGSSTFWLTGGYLGRSDVWCIDGVHSGKDLEKSWRRVSSSSPWHGRFDHGLVVMDGKLILMGGENSALGFGGPYFNDVWVAPLPGCSSFDLSEEVIV